MSDWVLTKGLQNLRDQVNEAFPDRDKASDGTIGDKAHQAETSGHNPDDTAGSRPEWNGDPDSTSEVRAWDMDSDLRAAPATAQQVVDHIRGLPGVSGVLRYMIYNRKIYKAANGWRAESYTGPSAHTEHIHFDGAWSQAADNDTTFDYRLEEIPVALTAADRAWVEGLFKAYKDDYAEQVLVGTRLAGTETGPAGSYQRNLADLTSDVWSLMMRGNTRGGDKAPEAGLFAQLLAELADVKAQLAKVTAAK